LKTKYKCSLGQLTKIHINSDLGENAVADWLFRKIWEELDDEGDGYPDHQKSCAEHVLFHYYVQHIEMLLVFPWPFPDINQVFDWLKEIENHD
jgi:hypothetical protein